MTSVPALTSNMAAARAIQLLDWDGLRWLSRWWMKSGEWVSSLDAILVVDIGPVPVDLSDISSTRSHMMCRANSIRCHLYLMSPHLVPISIPRHMINICLNLNPIHYPHMCSVLALSTRCHTLQACPRITCLTQYFDTSSCFPISSFIPLQHHFRCSWKISIASSLAFARISIISSRILRPANTSRLPLPCFLSFRVMLSRQALPLLMSMRTL
jgi:hypothetical protein